jgi:hypothetical protein
MRLQLIVRDNGAELLMTADSDFEKETLDRVNKAFPQRVCYIQVDRKDRYYDSSETITAACITVDLLPEKPLQ